MEVGLRGSRNHRNKAEEEASPREKGGVVGSRQKTSKDVTQRMVAVRSNGECWSSGYI